MLKMGQTVHRDLERNRDLLLDLLGRDPRPLRDDLHVVVRHVGVRLDRQAAERDDPPDEQQHADGQHEEAVVQRKIDECAEHRLGAPPSHCSAVFWKRSALAMTGSPGRSPDRSCCMLPASIGPPTTSRRSKRPSPSGTYTQSRSCRCRTAAAGTTARVSVARPRNVALTNMPMRRIPGFATSMRIFAVRIVGSRIGAMLLMRPFKTRSGYAAR